MHHHAQLDYIFGTFFDVAENPTINPFKKELSS
jgi:hypothetical protein